MGEFGCALVIHFNLNLWLFPCQTITSPHRYKFRSVLDIKMEVPVVINYVVRRSAVSFPGAAVPAKWRLIRSQDNIGTFKSGLEKDLISG